MQIMKSFFLAGVSLAAALVMSQIHAEAQAQAQATNTALSGTVSSAKEGAMEGVLVSAKKDGSTITTTVVTNDKGQYVFPADRLEVVEVLTPSGNWSSWPPHKHDVDDMPDEAVLEEIYHYRFRRPEAWAIQRVYRADRSRDGIWEVRDGDVVLVTDGYHPFSATHGDDAYYLNALAGDRRTMACSFDPDLDWVRSTWASMAADPRVPIVPAAAAATG